MIRKGTYKKQGNKRTKKKHNNLHGNKDSK